ncbi:hypothetical protein AB4120_05510 [Cupriavidus sp. 2KB_3]|uniref:hypothetical protein n=1 Tax=Cupriavidus TaxID=106589 RepID=UPI00165687CB|nr:hypothetical protein [Cupriavidus campinensis]
MGGSSGKFGDFWFIRQQSGTHPGAEEPGDAQHYAGGAGMTSAPEYAFLRDDALGEGPPGGGAAAWRGPRMRRFFDIAKVLA